MHSSRSLGSLLTIVALMTCSTSAHATINMTGDWYLFVSPQKTLVHFIQTGTSLQISGTFNTQQGTIDSTSGAFTWTGIDIVDGSCGSQLQGTVSPNGLTLTGTALAIVTPPTCQSMGCACSGNTPLGPISGSKSPCGNGVVDPGEECDDGNLGLNGDCCALGCSALAKGTSCPTLAACATGGACDGAGSCVPNSFASAGTPCPTVDPCANSSLCNGAGACVPIFAPSVGCKTGARHSAVLLQAPPHARLLWTWPHGAPTSSSDYGDPTTKTDYTLCVYDSSATGAFLATEVAIPAGGTCGRKPCWHATHSGFKYGNEAGTPAGVLSATLKVGAAPGVASIKLKGRGPNLPLPTLPLQKDPKIVVALRNSTGACWAADYSTAQRNDVTQFRAKSQ
jgi:cysteine-rich repeat protein